MLKLPYTANIIKSIYVTASYTLSFLMAENPSSVCFGCLWRKTHHSNFIQNFLVHFLVRKVMIAFFHSMKFYGRHFCVERERRCCAKQRLASRCQTLYFENCRRIAHDALFLCPSFVLSFYLIVPSRFNRFKDLSLKSRNIRTKNCAGI